MKAGVWVKTLHEASTCSQPIKLQWDNGVILPPGVCLKRPS